MKKNMSPGEAAVSDAIELLKADHLRVEHLFARFDALKDGDDDDEKSRVVANICKELTLHTMLEEEVFYPAVRQAIEDADQMDEALVEHAGAKLLIAQLRAAHPDDPLYDAKVTVLGEQIAHHVTEEEGSMFPKASHAGLDLEDLGHRLLLRRRELLAAPPEAASKAAGPQEDAAMAEEAMPRSQLRGKSRARLEASAPSGPRSNPTSKKLARTKGPSKKAPRNKAPRRK